MALNDQTIAGASLYFKKYNREHPKEISETPIIQKKRLNKQSKKSKLIKALKLARSIIIGSVAIYACYKIFNKSNVKSTTKFK